MNNAFVMIYGVEVLCSIKSRILADIATYYCNSANVKA